MESELTRFYFVRHGETDNNLEGKAQGLIDTDLNATGRDQAERVPYFFANQNISAIYSSPASRAASTAAPLSIKSGIPISVDERLVEMDQGDYDGLSREEMRSIIPSNWLETWRNQDPTDLRIPNGETLGEVRDRMVEICDELALRHTGQTIVIFSHNLAIKTFLCHALGISLSNFRKIDLANCSLSEVETVPGDYWMVSRINQVIEV